MGQAGARAGAGKWVKDRVFWCPRGGDPAECPPINHPLVGQPNLQHPRSSKRYLSGKQVNLNSCKYHTVVGFHLQCNRPGSGVQGGGDPAECPNITTH